MTVQEQTSQTATGSEVIQYEVNDGVATIWLNRPEVKNCVNWDLLTGLGRGARARRRGRRRSRGPDPRTREHLLRGRRPEHARQRVPGHDEQLGEDRPGLGPHVRSRVQPRQADHRGRRGLRRGRRLRAHDLLRLLHRRRRRAYRRLPHPPRAVRRRRADLPPAALHRAAQDQGAAVHRQAAVRQGVRGLGPGQRLRAVRPARPGDRGLHRTDARQERVHDAHHEAGGQPRPRRRYRDADRAREHDLQRRAPVRRTPRRACRPSSRSATPSGSTPDAGRPAGARGMDFGFDDKTSSCSERLLEFMDECVYPAEARFRDGGRVGRRSVGHPAGPRGAQGRGAPSAACGTCSCPGPTSSGQV